MLVNGLLLGLNVQAFRKRLATRWASFRVRVGLVALNLRSAMDTDRAAKGQQALSV